MWTTRLGQQPKLVWTRPHQYSCSLRRFAVQNGFQLTHSQCKSGVTSMPGFANSRAQASPRSLLSWARHMQSIALVSKVRSHQPSSITYMDGDNKGQHIHSTKGRLERACQYLEQKNGVELTKFPLWDRTFSLRRLILVVRLIA